MIRRPSNTCVIAQGSKTADIDLSIAKRGEYQAIFEIYGFIGYKYKKLAQGIKNDKVVLYDLLSKTPILSEYESNKVEERDIIIIQDFEEVKNNGWLIVQKTKIDWNALHKAIDILKYSDLKTTAKFKILTNDLAELDIELTISQIVPLILMYKNKRPRIAAKYDRIAIRSTARIDIDPKAIHIIDPEITLTGKKKGSSAKQPLVKFDIMNLRNIVRF